MVASALTPGADIAIAALASSASSLLASLRTQEFDGQDGKRHLGSFNISFRL
jgi:hypothetical protein